MANGLLHPMTIQWQGAQVALKAKAKSMRLCGFTLPEIRAAIPAGLWTSKGLIVGQNCKTPVWGKKEKKTE